MIKTLLIPRWLFSQKKFDWSKEDAVPDLTFNEILWQGIKGASAPSPVRAAFLKRNHKEDRGEKDDD